MNITLHGGPANLTQVPEHGQDEIVVNFSSGKTLTTAYYERFSTHPHEAFYSHTEYLTIQTP